MTRERYFKMCEQLGQEPNENEIPPDIEDFPQIAIQALTTFSNLGDRVYPDIGYMGKDFTTLPLLLRSAWSRKQRIILRDSNILRIKGYQNFSRTT